MLKVVTVELAENHLIATRSSTASSSWARGRTSAASVVPAPEPIINPFVSFWVS